MFHVVCMLTETGKWFICETNKLLNWGKAFLKVILISASMVDPSTPFLVMGVDLLTHSFHWTILFLVLGSSIGEKVLPLQSLHRLYIHSMFSFLHTTDSTTSEEDDASKSPSWCNFIILLSKFSWILHARFPVHYCWTRDPVRAAFKKLGTGNLLGWVFLQETLVKILHSVTEKPSPEHLPASPDLSSLPIHNCWNVITMKEGPDCICHQLSLTNGWWHTSCCTHITSLC